MLLLREEEDRELSSEDRSRWEEDLRRRFEESCSGFLCAPSRCQGGGFGMFRRFLLERGPRFSLLVLVVSSVGGEVCAKVEGEPFKSCLSCFVIVSTLLTVVATIVPFLEPVHGHPTEILGKNL